MEALVEWLKVVFGKWWLIVLPIIVALGFAYNKHQAEKQWHYWVATEEVHYHDQVIYKDGMIKVHWDKLPKVPNCAFEERWHIYIPQQGWVPVKEWDYQKYDVPPYRHGPDDFKGKDVDFWGDWVSIARRPLTPGVYEIRVSYQYDCFNWGVNNWEAEQRIVFEVTDVTAN